MGRTKHYSSPSFTSTVLSSLASTYTAAEPILIGAGIAYFVMGVYDYFQTPSVQCFNGPASREEIDNVRQSKLGTIAKVSGGMFYSGTWPLSKWVCDGASATVETIGKVVTAINPPPSSTKCNCGGCKYK